jgi:MFS family permease
VGRALSRYTLWLAIGLGVLTAVWTAVPSVILPNHIQDITFSHWFTGSDAHVDLQKLTDLKSAVDDGKVQPTADQRRLLGILKDFDDARASALAFVITLAGVGSMLSQLAIGVLSDRTRSRHGKRAPWIVAGSIAVALVLVGMRFAPSVPLLAVLWALCLGASNFAYTPLLATVADRVPEGKRGTVSSMSGLGNFLGGVAATVVVGAAFGLAGLNLYVVLGLVLVVSMVLFVLRNRDHSSTATVLAPFDLRAFLRGFFIPLRSADFRWVWIARLLLIFGYYVSSTLGLFMLQSYIEPALSAEEATKTLPLLGAAGAPVTMIAIVLAGRISDRIGRRKPFVIVASALMAVAMLIPLISPTLPALFAQAVLGALAFGIFLPVDQALFVDVLPDKEGAGRDLGIAGIATNLGQILAPFIAAGVVAVSDGYRMIWVVAFALVGLAAAAIFPVRSVR